MTQTTAKDAATQAANQLGWNPQLVLNQWALETGNFTSQAWMQDNNPAGIKWYPGMGYGSQGTPASDGGYYAKFSDPVQGYVSFVQNNGRYSGQGTKPNGQPYLNVASFPTVQGEANALQYDGWATDPNYANKVSGVGATGNQGVSTSNSGTYSTPTGVTGYLKFGFWGILGIVLIGLGIWVMLNPFSDLSTAVRSISQNLAKRPFEGATSAVRNYSNNQRQNARFREENRQKKRIERFTGANSGDVTGRKSTKRIYDKTSTKRKDISRTGTDDLPF